MGAVATVVGGGATMAVGLADVDSTRLVDVVGIVGCRRRSRNTWERCMWGQCSDCRRGLADEVGGVATVDGRCSDCGVVAMEVGGADVDA